MAASDVLLLHIYSDNKDPRHQLRFHSVFKIGPLVVGDFVLACHTSEIDLRDCRLSFPAHRTL